MATAALLNRAGWEIKSEEDLARVLSQAEVVRGGAARFSICEGLPILKRLPFPSIFPLLQNGTRSVPKAKQRNCSINRV